MPTEEELLLELEIAGLRHQTALFYLQQMSDFSEELPVERAVFQVAVRNVQHAGEVYDMAALHLMAYLRHAKIRPRLAR
jgi:hypothetical protein